MNSYTSDRIDLLNRLITPSDKVVEIGPGYTPICDKSDYDLCIYVDALTKEELELRSLTTPFTDIEKAATQHRVDVIFDNSLIKSIESSSYSKEIGDFDCIAASHVIEHIPNHIGFFKDAEQMLKPGGVIVGANPIPEMCFDCFRPYTTIGDLIDRYHNDMNAPDLKSIIDTQFYQHHLDGRGMWEKSDLKTSTPLPVYTDVENVVKNIYESTLQRLTDGEYIDVHTLVASPDWFALLMFDLYLSGYSKYTVETMIILENEYFFRLKDQTEYAKNLGGIDYFKSKRDQLYRKIAGI